METTNGKDQEVEKLAEEKYPFLDTKYISPNDIGYYEQLTEIKRGAFIKGYKAAQSHPTTTVLWVKASERFPESKIWRVKYAAVGTHSIDSSKYKSHDEQNIYFYGAEPLLLSNIEWLDESAVQPSTVLGWVDVKSGVLPEIGKKVLVIVGENTVLMGRRLNNGWTAFFADGEILCGQVREVTQWMEAPEPPNKSNSTPTPTNETEKTK